MAAPGRMGDFKNACASAELFVIAGTLILNGVLKGKDRERVNEIAIPLIIVIAVAYVMLRTAEEQELVRHCFQERNPRPCTRAVGRTILSGVQTGAALGLGSAALGLIPTVTAAGGIVFEI